MKFTFTEIIECIIFVAVFLKRTSQEDDKRTLIKRNHPLCCCE